MRSCFAIAACSALAWLRASLRAARLSASLSVSGLKTGKSLIAMTIITASVSRDAKSENNQKRKYLYAPDNISGLISIGTLFAVLKLFELILNNSIPT